MRLTKVLRKMDEFVSDKAIIKLQEVSHSWAGPLHVYLAKNNYQFVYAPYGKHWNNYMGVGVAYPIMNYEAVDVHIQVVIFEHREAELCKLCVTHSACSWLQQTISDKIVASLPRSRPRAYPDYGLFAPVSKALSAINNMVAKSFASVAVAVGVGKKKSPSEWDKAKTRLHL